MQAGRPRGKERHRRLERQVDGMPVTAAQQPAVARKVREPEAVAP